MKPGCLDAVLITHEHIDHVAGADLISKRFSAPLAANSATLANFRKQTALLEFSLLSTGSTVTLGAFEVTSFPVSHDAVEPVGYAIECAGSRIAVMTDLGSVTPELREPVSCSDLVVLEANHDTERLVNGPYPQYLKRRILSETGHLSNVQTAELIGAALSSHPQTFWLAHLSRTNNTQKLARNGVLEHLSQQGLAPNVMVTSRDRPSLVWEPGTGDTQLSLFGARSG